MKVPAAADIGQGYSSGSGHVVLGVWVWFNFTGRSTLGNPELLNNVSDEKLQPSSGMIDGTNR